MSVLRRRSFRSGNSNCHPGISAASPKPRDPASNPAVVRFTNRKSDSIVRVIRENRNTICVRFAPHDPQPGSFLLQLLFQLLKPLLEIPDSGPQILGIRRGDEGPPFGAVQMPELPLHLRQAERPPELADAALLGRHGDRLLAFVADDVEADRVAGLLPPHRRGEIAGACDTRSVDCGDDVADAQAGFGARAVLSE